jgi:hypothetical protein
MKRKRRRERSKEREKMWERVERIKESETNIRYTWYIFMERQFLELDFFCKIAVLRAMVVKDFFLLEDDTTLSGTYQRF